VSFCEGDISPFLLRDFKYSYMQLIIGIAQLVNILVKKTIFLVGAFDGGGEYIGRRKQTRGVGRKERVKEER
jgi:hypothetical protein